MLDNDAMRLLEAWALWNTLRGQGNPFNLAMRDVDTDAPVREDIIRGDREVGGSNDRITEANKLLAQSSFSHDNDVSIEAEVRQYLVDRNTSGLREQIPDLGNANGATLPQDPSVRGPASSFVHGTCEYDQSTIFTDSAVSSDVQVSAAAEFDKNTQLTSRTAQAQIPRLPLAVIPPATNPAQHAPPATTTDQTSIVLAKCAVSRPKRLGRPPAPKIRGVTRLPPIVPGTKKTTLTAVEEDTHNSSEEAIRAI